MATFEEQWLECQDKYGKNIEAGDMQVLGLNQIDETVSLPAVKFTGPYDPSGSNVFESYVHVPMATFKKRIDDLSDEVSEATSDLETLKGDTEEARDDANAAASRADTAADGAENVNATMVGMTVTITNRDGISHSENIGFEITEDHVYPSYNAMLADAANVLPGKFCIIATTDPTQEDNAKLYTRNSSPATSAKPFTFLSDLDQASSAAFADWLNNYKPVIEADHQQAVLDHQTSTTDHGQYLSDTQRAGQDHQTSTTDHQQYLSDTQRAGQDHETSTIDHGQYLSDTQRAGQDHQTSTTDHQQYQSDTQRAGQDHQTSTTDHGQYLSDTQRASDDHDQAVRDHDASVQATNAANTEANRAKGYNDNPWEIGDDGYIYVWDETTQAMVQTNKMIIDFSDLTPEQQAAMVQEFLSHLTFDETPTAGSPNAVTSRGIKAALDLKQDLLEFATDQLCTDAAADIVFIPTA